jgi:hypothetical protein
VNTFDSQLKVAVIALRNANREVRRLSALAKDEKAEALSVTVRCAISHYVFGKTLTLEDAVLVEE